MPATARPSSRRPVTRRPLLLLLLVGALAVALVATFLQVRPQSSAAEMNAVEISHGSTAAELKAGTEDTCVVTSRTNVFGDPERVREVTEAVSKSARESGFTFTTGSASPAPDVASTDLILSQEFTLSDPDFGPENCSTALVIDEHRGRNLAEVPAWARGMLAAAAGTAVYLGVVFAVAALFAFLAPEFFIVGELIGGCVGGFASTFVANLINKVPQAANMTQSAVQCVAGALLNVTLGAVKTNLVGSLRGWLDSPKIAAVVEDGASRAVSSASSEAIFESARSFSIELAALEVP